MLYYINTYASQCIGYHYVSSTILLLIYHYCLCYSVILCLSYLKTCIYIYVAYYERDQLDISICG